MLHKIREKTILFIVKNILRSKEFLALYITSDYRYNLTSSEIH